MKLFHDKLIRWIINDSQPFTTVENPEFRDLLVLLKPDIIIPSASTIRNEIKSAFTESYNNIKIKLQVRRIIL